MKNIKPNLFLGQSRFPTFPFGLILCFFLLGKSTPAAGQRYMPEFDSEESKALFDKAERNYVQKKYDRSVKLYDDLMAMEGERPEFLFNQLTALIHTTDTARIEQQFNKLLESDFLDCYYLSVGEDFKQIKYRFHYDAWNHAMRQCAEKEKAFIIQNNVQNPDLRKQLLWMKLQDVTSDVKIAHKIRYGAYPDLSFEQLKEERQKIYVNNLMQLLAFTQENGWPTISMVGEDGAEAAWLIAQHGNHLPPAQEVILRLMEEAVQKGEAKKEHYAHLYDRVQANRGKPQKYGTLRWKNPETNLWELYPLEDTVRVNEWRKEVGLKTLNLKNEG
ncbi:MAG: hypothetical protein D6714_12365 [Bacteroidetes bacterium]|nr:MAG: hypothetical protein D6714_12365 [Bacteroidota bacterium]